jgi:hypothetical protein
MNALANDDIVSICTPKKPVQHFEAETDYLCNRDLKKVTTSRINPKSAWRYNTTAYMYADNLMKNNNLDQAAELYSEMAKSSYFLVNYPVIAISSLGRLGDVESLKKNRQMAAAHYQNYLESWESLDIPLNDYLRITSITQNFNKVK